MAAMSYTVFMLVLALVLSGVSVVFNASDAIQLVQLTNGHIITVLDLLCGAILYDSCTDFIIGMGED